MANLIKALGTSLLAASIVAPVSAADTAKLSMGGLYAAAAAAYDTPSDVNLKDIAFKGAVIDFKGRTILDKSLEVGFHTVLSREDHFGAPASRAADQVQSLFVYVKSGVGVLALGEPAKASTPLDDMARYITHFTRPDDKDISVPAFHPLKLHDSGGQEPSSALSKVSYFTPRIGGVQFGVSFNPNNARTPASLTDLPVPAVDAAAKTDALELAANYKTEFNGFRVELGGSYLNGQWHARTADDLVQWGASGSFVYSLPHAGGDLALAGTYRNTNCADFICGTGLSAQTETSSNAWNFGLRYSVGAWALGGYVLTGHTDASGLGLPNHTTTVFLQTAIDF